MDANIKEKLIRLQADFAALYNDKDAGLLGVNESHIHVNNRVFAWIAHSDPNSNITVSKCDASIHLSTAVNDVRWVTVIN